MSQIDISGKGINNQILPDISDDWVICGPTDRINKKFTRPLKALRSKTKCIRCI